MPSGHFERFSSIGVLLHWSELKQNYSIQIKIGRGGLVVNVRAFFCDDPSLNPSVVCNLIANISYNSVKFVNIYCSPVKKMFCQKVAWKDKKRKEKMPGLAHDLKIFSAIFVSVNEI